MAADFNSPYYPYEKTQSGYLSFRGAEEIPYRILMYLLDLPDKNGYFPVDDNRRARVRLIKYLCCDGANPLGEALPTPKEKLSLVFDGNEPVVASDEEKKKHPLGYRIYPQMYWGQSQTEAKTTLKCYIGRVIPTGPFTATIGLHFEILSNVNIDNTTKTSAYSRAYNIEQCLIEALHGVNIAGVGVCDFSRGSHIENGSRPIADEGVNVGREVRLSVDWAESNMAEADSFCL